MHPPPPTSTLFPYTTLFRSQVRALDTMPSKRDEVIEAQVALDDLKTLRALLKRDPTQTKYFQRKRAELPLLRKLLDRKSTRLNSSHTVISYAVFCLKKKS